MSLYLDNQLLPTDELADGATVGQVLELARAEAARTRSLIVAIQCNQEVVPADRLEWMLQQPARDFERIDLTTGHPKDVVLEALEQTQAMFGQTFPLVKRTSDDLSSGRISEAMQTFTSCVSAWGCTHEAVVQSARLLGVDFEQLHVNDQPVSFWLERLAARLADVKSAIEARDHVQLCDILRYELDETLREWEGILDGFIEHVRRTDYSRHPAPSPERPA